MSITTEIINEICHKAFPKASTIEVEVLSLKTMGFSGAGVAELNIRFDHASSRRMFLKHIVIPEPESDGAHGESVSKKIWRDISSYKNEFQVMHNLFPKMDASEPPIQHPTVHYKSAEKTAAGHVFTTLSDSMFAEGWTQVPVLSSAQLDASLQWLARFHAMSFGERLSECATGLWESGTHLALEKRPANEVEKLPGIWSGFVKAFAAEHTTFGQDVDTVAAVGVRLSAAAPRVAAYLDPRALHNAGRTCIVHGDYKSANMFVTADEEGVRHGVSAIDYQWTGPGLPATDLVYLIAMALPAPTEEALEGTLRGYHRHFVEARTKVCGEEAGEENKASFRQLELDFKVALIDFTRWAFCARLSGDTPEKFRSRLEKMDINLGAWRRDVHVIAWLTERTILYLNDADVVRAIGGEAS